METNRIKVSRGEVEARQFIMRRQKHMSIAIAILMLGAFSTSVYLGISTSSTRDAVAWGLIAVVACLSLVLFATYALALNATLDNPTEIAKSIAKEKIAKETPQIADAYYFDPEDLVGNSRDYWS